MQESATRRGGREGRLGISVNGKLRGTLNLTEAWPYTSPPLSANVLNLTLRLLNPAMCPYARTTALDRDSSAGRSIHWVHIGENLHAVDISLAQRTVNIWYASDCFAYRFADGYHRMRRGFLGTARFGEHTAAHAYRSPPVVTVMHRGM